MMPNAKLTQKAGAAKQSRSKAQLCNGRIEMKAWTDYPFTWLGDTTGEEAPVREIEVMSYDDNKYCRIKVGGGEDEIKAGYIYQREGRYGEVPPITRRQLAMLVHNPKLTGERMNVENEASPANKVSDVERVVMRTPFAWATFDGEGGYDLRLYEGNELYHDDWVQANGAKYESWVFPLYLADA